MGDMQQVTSGSLADTFQGIRSVGAHSLRPSWRELRRLNRRTRKALSHWQRAQEKALEAGWSDTVTLPSDVNPTVHETDRTYFSKPKGVRYESITAAGTGRRRRKPLRITVARPTASSSAPGSRRASRAPGAGAGRPRTAPGGMVRRPQSQSQLHSQSQSQTQVWTLDGGGQGLASTAGSWTGPPPSPVGAGLGGGGGAEPGLLGRTGSSLGTVGGGGRPRTAPSPASASRRKLGRVPSGWDGLGVADAVQSPHDHPASPSTWFSAPDTSGLGAAGQGIPGHDTAIARLDVDDRPVEDVMEGIPGALTEEASMAEELGGWLSAPVSYARTPKQRKEEARLHASRRKRATAAEREEASAFVVNVQVRANKGDGVVGKRRRGSVVVDPATKLPATDAEGRLVRVGVGGQGRRGGRGSGRGRGRARVRGHDSGGGARSRRQHDSGIATRDDDDDEGEDTFAEEFPHAGGVPQTMKTMTSTASSMDLLRHNMRRLGQRPKALDVTAVEGAQVSVFMHPGRPIAQSRGVLASREELREYKNMMVRVGVGKTDAKGKVTVTCFCPDWRLKDAIVRVDPGPGGGHLSPEEHTTRLSAKLSRLTLRLEPAESRRRRLLARKREFEAQAADRMRFEQARGKYLTENSKKMAGA